MPDPNKLKLYAEHGVETAKCCGTCAHFYEMVGDKNWGGCEKLPADFEHSKHGQCSTRVNVAFVCPAYELGEPSPHISIGGYAKLMSEDA